MFLTGAHNRRFVSLGTVRLNGEAYVSHVLLMLVTSDEDLRKHSRALPTSGRAAVAELVHHNLPRRRFCRSSSQDRLP
jgi:hypothetical protein